MVFFEYIRDAIFAFISRGSDSSSPISSAVSAIFANDEIDQLIAEGEGQLDVATNSGSNTTAMLVIVFFLILAIVLIIVGRNVRNNKSDNEAIADDANFEDQFGVDDFDGDDANQPVMAAANSEMTNDNTEISYATDDQSSSDEAKSIFDDVDNSQTEDAHIDDDASDEAQNEVSSDDIETDDQDTHAETDASEDEDTSDGNIIHLSERADDAEPCSDDNADEEADDDELTSTHDEVEESHEEEEAEATQYAAANASRSPLVFSNISSSDDNDEDEISTDDSDHEPQETRPYIAPTVLREDMIKLEQQQASRINDLQADVSRQIASMKSESNNRLDLIINALDRKIDGLAEATRQQSSEPAQVVAQLPNEVASQINTLQNTLENQGQRIRAITQILDDRLDSVSHVYGEVRAISELIAAFDKKLEKLENSIVERAHQDVIADVQLTDVIRSSLSPDDYEFKALLSNNNRADCLIKLPHPPGAIVIDTRFPLDAFNALPGRDDIAKGNPQAKAAEDSFRRSVLRHIIDVAERYILPGETADSALLFLPTEAIYTTLHARFPDLVRDSFRARVWIVSPSTLMGTLQTLRGVLRDTKDFQNAEAMRRESQEVMSEMETLRSRASMLAQNFEQTQNELRSLLDATNSVMSKSPSAPPHNALMEQLYDKKPQWPGTPADQSDDKPKSPSLFDDEHNWPGNLR